MKRNTSYGQHLDKLTIIDYKSIAHCDLEFGAINVLIGSNGAGKSNLLSFFNLIRELLKENLQVFVGKQGGPDSILRYGRKVTETMSTNIRFGNNTYIAEFEATKDNRLMIKSERLLSDTSNLRCLEKTDYVRNGDIENKGYFESKMLYDAKLMGLYNHLVSFTRYQVYHFDDTSDNAYIKQFQVVDDNSYLRHDARNLAAFLYFLEKHHNKEFQHITETVKMVAPFFGRFHLKPSVDNQETIEFRWFEDGHDIPFKAHHLSDGTLRFICLATLFLQPTHLQPETILIDEPELGLHPYAISILGSLIRSVAINKQIIVSTQSVDLLNEFDPEDVIVVDRKDGKSGFRRLEEAPLKEWLHEYTLGELWMKNIIGGRPAR